MKVTVAAVGKLRRSALEDLYRDYVDRLRWPVSLHEIDAAKRATGTARRELEAMKLGRLIPDKSVIVALDERGRDLASADLASLIERWQVEGHGHLAFFIGGPDGLAPAITEAADLVLAFGRATWPHRLVRVMLAEQLYRAASIISGHPYHRGD